MQGNLPRLLPLLHTLVEERVGERRLPIAFRPVPLKQTGLSVPLIINDLRSVKKHLNICVAIQVGKL